SLRVNGQIASLENIYRSSVLQPEQMNQFVQQWMLELIRAGEGQPDLQASYDELKDRILPMVLREDAAQQGIVSQTVVSGLVVTYVVDRPRTIWYIAQSTFERWNISLDALHETAINNLISRSQAIAAQAAQDEDGQINLILFQTSDGFDSSRILL